MLREIVLDTETTGLDAQKGDRLIEIGCIELLNRIPSGREFHAFINPEREVPAAAQAVHGISTDFLRDKPLFAKVAKDFLSFIGADVLVIHNAQFDIGFINMELMRIGETAISFERVIDTLQIARRKHPAGPNTLDGLCKRYGIDNSKRIKHGALMDSLLLAEVYVELIGERQATLGLGAKGGDAAQARTSGTTRRAQQRPKALPSRLTPALEADHRAFVETLGPKAIWKRYMDETEISREGVAADAQVKAG